MNANAVHTLWTSAAADPISKIPSPTIEYAQLAPVMIVIGAAVIGIVVEAFAPRRARYHIQLWLTVVALGAAFASVVALAVGGYATTKQTSVAMGALAVDGLTLFLQGVILLSGVLAAFTFAERRLDRAHGKRVDSFVAQAGAVPGSEAEQAAVKAGFATTEVFPLMLFAVGGMIVFPAANDLLTLFIALEVFSLPLYLMCALARHAAAHVAGVGGQVLPPRRLLLRLPPLRRRPALRLLGLRLVRRDRRRRRWHADQQRPGPRPDDGQRRAAPDRHGPGPDGAALQGRCRPVPHVDARRLPGRPDPGHRFHGRRHQGRRLRRPAPPALRGAARDALGLAAGDVGRRHRHDGGRRDRRRHPDRREAAAGLLLGGARGLHPRRCDRRHPGRRLLRPLLPRRLLLRDHRRLRRRHPGAGRRGRGHPPLQVGGARPALPWSPRSSRSSCWPSPESR